MREHFDVEEVSSSELDPAGEDGVGVFGYIDSHHRKGFRLRLKDPARRSTRAARGQLRGLPPPRRGDPRDAGAEGAARDERRGHRGQARHRLREVASRTRSALLDDGAYDVAFILRPTPGRPGPSGRGGGENMPPKSTYFFPKVLTGLVFNPLS